MIAAVHVSSTLGTVLVLIAILWFAMDVIVTSYGFRKGFSSLPLFICCLALGWPLVLLAVTIASGLQQPRR